MLQAGGHFLRGRLIPERAARPRLAAGGLKATGHPGILTGAGGTLLLGAGEGEASGERGPEMAAPIKVAACLSPPSNQAQSPGPVRVCSEESVIQTHLA